MILTCPDCTTRYFVEDSKLGPDGRTVRCASCGTSWHARADEPLELTNSPDEGAIGREGPSLKADEPGSVAAPELPKAFRAKVQQQRKVREAAAAGVVWAGMVSGLMALLVAAYVFRVDIVKLYPRAAGAYAFARVPVNPTGLEFEKVKAEPAPGGLMAIQVSGQIRNVEEEASAPPPIRIALLDKNGRRIATKLAPVSHAPIAPGKTLAFSAVLPDPKALADDVAVEFALELAPKPQPRPKAKAAAPKAAPPKAAPLRSAPAPVASKAPSAAAAKAGSSTATPQLRRSQAAPPPRPVEARPLPANDPYALDTGASRAVSAGPHG
ncbi:MAG TPA: DUF3426 domain-containing protein [Caulobacteraceae bacterium]|nr:DUF3426 domain-containing protein [Caulobacteraceae bacterium]